MENSGVQAGESSCRLESTAPFVGDRNSRVLCDHHTSVPLHCLDPALGPSTPHPHDDVTVALGVLGPSGFITAQTSRRRVCYTGRYVCRRKGT